VRRGEGAREIAQRLEQEGVISSQHLFVIHYMARQFSSKPLQLKAGEYEMQPGVSMRQVADLLGEGRSQLVRLTIPEGLTSHQVVERLRAEPALTGDIDKIPPEGSILPETYKVPRGATRQAVIELMQSEQRRLIEAAWANRQPDLPLQSIEEAIILAATTGMRTSPRCSSTGSGGACRCSPIRPSSMACTGAR